MRQKRQFLALMRHGESLSNRDLTVNPCGLYYAVAGSDLSVPLTDEGIRQVDLAGEELARLFPEESPIAQIWDNRFDRVGYSADRVEQKLGYRPRRRSSRRIEKRSYGLFWNLTYRGVQELHPEEYARYLAEGALNYRPPGGENYPDLFARVREFIDIDLEPCEGHQLIVTSLAAILAFHRELSSLPDEEAVRMYEASALPNASIHLYVREGPGHPWQLVPVARDRAVLVCQ